MSKENLDDKVFVLEQVQKNSYALRTASKRLQDDEEIVLSSVKQNGVALVFASDRLKDDKAIVLAAVQNRCYALIHASDRLKDDEDVVLYAVNQNHHVLKYASDRLRSDVNFCIACAKISKESTFYFKGKAKKIFQAQNNNPEAIELFYTQQQQNKANEALLAKLSKTEAVVTNKLFKRRLDV